MSSGNKIHVNGEDNSQLSTRNQNDPISGTANHAVGPGDNMFEKLHSLEFSAEPSVKSTKSTMEGVSTRTSTDDLEKIPIGPMLLQNELGAHGKNAADVGPIVSRGHGPFDSSQSKYKISIPPKQTTTLPGKRQGKIWRGLRHNLLAVYQRLFCLVLVGNMVALIVTLVNHRDSKPCGPPLGNLATATAANIIGALLIRQEHVINGLYTIFCWTPLWMPLRIRCLVAKLYHFGGVHSGCGTSATVWFILYTVLVTKQQVDGDLDQPAVIAITYVLVALLLSITLLAIPKFRMVSHNTFEAVHRFSGWTAVALFWVQVLLTLHAQSQAANSDSFGELVIKAPAFWLLLTITFLIILPWLRLKKVEATPEFLSDHAIRIHFKYIKVSSVMALRIAGHPLREWHAFATIPEPDKSSFSLIVSDNGDWTRKQILEPAKSYWVRGIPVQGLLRMATVFKKVIFVTTGSGIGPVLSMLVAHPLPCRVIWSTPNPVHTYGDNIMQMVANVDPDAMIINSRATGRPDLVGLTYHLYQEAQAEAVFCISNPHLTYKVIYGMESRGVPAFGPIWDS